MILWGHKSETPVKMLKNIVRVHSFRAPILSRAQNNGFLSLCKVFERDAHGGGVGRKVKCGVEKNPESTGL